MKTWIIGGIFDSEYPQKVRYDHLTTPRMEKEPPGPGKTTRVAPLPQSRMMWRKACKNFCPKTFATPIWFGHNCLSHWRDVKPLQYKFGLHTIPYHIEEMQNLCNINLVCAQLLIMLKKCKTFATSSGLQMPNFFLIFSFAFSASGIPSLGVLRQGWAKSRDCD